VFRIAVCDDEEYYNIKIQNLLQEYFLKKEILYKVDIYNSGVQMLELGIGVKEYDLIFLDINMGELNGIETARKIREYTQETYIVFVTACAAYAMEGYKVNAIRYLLKEEDNFDMNFTECLEAIRAKRDDTGNMQTFEFQEGRKRVAYNNIIYIESDLHKLHFYIRNEEVLCYTMYGKLDVLEEELQACDFCRIHKSYLVNLRYMESLKRYRVVLSDGNELNIAKQRYKEVVSKYYSYYRTI